MNYNKQSVNLITGTIEEKREEIKKQFLQTYELDEKLFDLLKEKEVYLRTTKYIKTSIDFLLWTHCNFFCK
jgi:hypothetical protein